MKKTPRTFRTIDARPLYTPDEFTRGDYNKKDISLIYLFIHCCESAKELSETTSCSAPYFLSNILMGNVNLVYLNEKNFN